MNMLGLKALSCTVAQTQADCYDTPVISESDEVQLFLFFIFFY